jgi:hypothetical protein
MAHTVMATFRVKDGALDRLTALLDSHFETIGRLGFGEGPAPVRLLAQEEDRAVLYEVFDWKDGAIGQAAQHPDVQTLWQAIDGCCEARGDKPALDFPQVRRLRASS